MAKLVDALVSGTSGSNAVQVRVLFWAQHILEIYKRSFFQNTVLILKWSKSLPVPAYRLPAEGRYNGMVCPVSFFY
jgi:hypothetical protein